MMSYKIFNPIPNSLMEEKSLNFRQMIFLQFLVDFMKWPKSARGRNAEEPLVYFALRKRHLLKNIGTNSVKGSCINVRTLEEDTSDLIEKGIIHRVTVYEMGERLSFYAIDPSVMYELLDLRNRSHQPDMEFQRDLNLYESILLESTIRNDPETEKDWHSSLRLLTKYKPRKSNITSKHDHRITKHDNPTYTHDDPTAKGREMGNTSYRPLVTSFRPLSINEKSTIENEKGERERSLTSFEKINAIEDLYISEKKNRSDKFWDFLNISDQDVIAKYTKAISLIRYRTKGTRITFDEIIEDFLQSTIPSEHFILGFEELLRKGNVSNSLEYFYRWAIPNGMNKSAQNKSLKKIKKTIPIQKERISKTQKIESHNWLYTCSECGEDIGGFETECPTCRSEIDWDSEVKKMA